jgi:hypothetical protein
MSNPSPAPTDGGQAPTSGSGQAPQQATDGQAPVSQTPSEHDRIIEQLRKENAEARTKLAAFEKAKQEAELAKLGDIEKAAKRAELAEAQVKTYQQQLATAHVKLAAQALGIIDPELAALAIASKLEFGEDGLPSNADKLLQELVKSKPYLVPKPPESPQTTPAQNGTPAVPAIPAMNPGRTSIAQPGAQPTTGKPPRLANIPWKS